MEFEKLISLILSIGVFLYLFFRDLKKENANVWQNEIRQGLTAGRGSSHAESVFSPDRAASPLE